MNADLLIVSETQRFLLRTSPKYLWVLPSHHKDRQRRQRPQRTSGMEDRGTPRITDWRFSNLVSCDESHQLQKPASESVTTSLREQSLRCPGFLPQARTNNTIVSSLSSMFDQIARSGRIICGRTTSVALPSGFSGRHIFDDGSQITRH